MFALQDEPEVARVWLPNSDSPGLAMARAFGDFCLKDYGLISVPDINYRRLTERDQFIILATDGVTFFFFLWFLLAKSNVDIKTYVAKSVCVNCARSGMFCRTKRLLILWLQLQVEKLQLVL